MSLIITSLNEKGDTLALGTSAPYQYRNHLRNPLIVKPNSEIAVESVKINRNPQLDYESGRQTLFWFGERLASGSDADDNLSYFIPSENLILNNESPLNFADKFKEILQDAYDFYPDTDTNNIEVNITTGTNGEFTGFSYKVPQVSTTASSVLSGDSFIKTMFRRTAGSNASFDGTTVEANADKTFCQILPKDDQGGPISIHSGSFGILSAGLSAKFTIGLSRPWLKDPANGRDHHPFMGHPDSGATEGIGPNRKDYYDYAIEVGDDNYIRLYHAVPNLVASSEDPDAYATNPIGPAYQHAMKEIKYYENTNSSFTANNVDNSSFATGTPIPSASMGDILFEVQGERVTISVSGTVVCKAVTANASTKSQIPKPLGQTCWKMYPTFSLWESGDTADITTWRCRTNTTLKKNVPEMNWLGRCQIPLYLNGTNETASFPQGPVYYPWNNAYHWVTEVDIRDFYQPYVANPATPATPIQGGSVRIYKGIQNSLFHEYENIFIMGDADRYVFGRNKEWQANSADVLGFEPLAINSDSGMTHSGGYHGASFSSAVNPSMLSQQSTFIRIPTLTHETYNFGTGNPSKILFQVPRFDNSGAETGALFFQNPSKTFIDLNNSTELRITDLDVHFVRKNEKFATDLTGSSEVVMIIRQKSRM